MKPDMFINKALRNDELVDEINRITQEFINAKIRQLIDLNIVLSFVSLNIYSSKFFISSI
jgi:hypothetical protein